jgi:hypothetical protein
MRASRNRPRTRRPPDFAPSSKTPDFASSLDSERLRQASREATSGRLSSKTLAIVKAMRDLPAPGGEPL